MTAVAAVLPMPTERWHERFLAKVSVSETGCWEFAAYPNSNGYARLYHTGQMRLAHRLAYEWLIGPIPDGLELDHLCRVRGCVNPAHMEPVTHRENLLRGKTIVALAASRVACPHGHPYAESNTYVRPKDGSRHCRTCGNDRTRRAYAARLGSNTYEGANDEMRRR